MKEIYTIGHSNHINKYFVNLLKNHGINCLVDVRSMPYSKFTPQYNKEDLKKYLKLNQIYYVFMGDELGARRNDKSLYTNEGYLDFDKTSKSILFQEGIERLKKGLHKGYNIALMCTEKDPIDCHRNILVARELFRQNIEIKNIHEDSSIETQTELEERLLNLYFPNRMQLTLIDLPKDRNEYLTEAYRLRNRDIAYSLENDIAKVL